MSDSALAAAGTLGIRTPRSTSSGNGNGTDTGDTTDQALARIRQRESGGQNIPNRQGPGGSPASTATGYYQILDSTWAEGVQLAGVGGQYRRAMDAPEAVQHKVARALYTKYGETPWKKSAEGEGGGAGGGAGDQQLRGIMGDIESASAEKQRLTQPIYEEMVRRYTSDRAQFDRIAKDYSPVQQTQAPPPPVNDPLAGFASVASIFAGLASAFTHTPAINAMNGMAAAINATKKNDWEAYKAGYDQWKQNTEFALERHKLWSQDMDTAIRQMQTDLNGGVALAKAVAAQSDDRISLKLLEANLLDKFAERKRAADMAAVQMQQYGQKIEEGAIKLQAQHDLAEALAAMSKTQPGSPEYEAAHQRVLAAGTILDPRVAATGELGGKVSAPVMAQVDKPDGGTEFTLVQQRPDGQWVTADEHRSPVENVRSVTKTTDVPAPNDPTVEKVAKQIANYQLPPLSGFVLKSPWGQAVMSKIGELNPDYQATEYGARSKAMRDFSTGPQGQRINSMNVAITHLDTLGQLADALKNQDVQAINRLGNAMAQATGQPAPTNFDAAKQIVGQEIIKSIISSGGGVTERQHAEEQLSRAMSPAQLKGVIDVYKQLMAGQLSGLRQQYEQTTGLKNFDERLSPEARQEIGSLRVQPLPMTKQDGRSVPDASKLQDGMVYVLPNGVHARFNEKSMDFEPQ